MDNKNNTKNGVITCLQVLGVIFTTVALLLDFGLSTVLAAGIGAALMLIALSITFGYWLRGADLSH